MHPVAAVAPLACAAALSASAPLAAAPPAQNGPIAFENREATAGKGDIFVVGPDGTGLRNLTHSAASEATPAWSPDGRRIAFAVVAASPRPGHAGDLWVMDADGSGRRRLTAGAAVADLSRITWSPDGRRIAFVATGDRLTTIASTGGSRTTVRTPGPASSPAWSPNGTRIAFGAAASWTGHQGIWTVPAGGGAGARLTRPAGSGSDFDPSWSPDGSRIAFERQPAVGHINVFVLARGSSRPLTRGFFNAISPQWSPDGTQIAFGGGKTPQGGNSLWVVSAAGGAPRRLATGVDVGEISWARGPG